MLMVRGGGEDKKRDGDLIASDMRKMRVSKEDARIPEL